MSIIELGNFYKVIKREAYKLIKHVYNVCLINHRLGLFTDNNFIAELRKLPSFYEVVFYVMKLE
ncbi:hypothetical protein CKY04_08770 [Photorhabdus sp. S8-52]|nr:hypothetical protein CKY03_15880 [Photorhabdus sp. S9-53]RAX00167.1 hypothetical protein CKY05_08700 [Photorhabdus sp. S10-54]RAX04501.1 hypothetical protein CKY04_08770 [Photorhabdus sp. S8-52]